MYRPTTGQWFIQGQPAHTFTTLRTGDIPVPGNYDNTGKDEPAIYRPSTGQWIIDGPNGVHTITFGGPNDIPVPGAYDALTTGTPAVEAAVWRRATGQFFVLGPKGGRMIQFAKGDIPAPGDYDLIGETEAAVYRPSTGQWLVLGPNDKTPRVFTTFGGPADVPTIAPYAHRALKSGGGLISAFSTRALIPVDLGATAQAFSSVSNHATRLGTFLPSATARAVPSTSGGRALIRFRPGYAIAHNLSAGTHRLLNRNLGAAPIRSPFLGATTMSNRGRLVHA